MTFKRLSIFFAASVFALYAGLVLSLFYFYKGSLFVETLLSERTLFSIKISLIAATIATLLALVLAVPSAYALSRFDFKGRNIIDTILELPMIVSPAALGAMLLIFFNNPIGMWIQDNYIQFVFTAYGIILAQFITTVGVSTRLIKAAMDEIPHRYEDVARSLGVTPVKAFLTVTLPLCKNGIIAASVLTWAKAIGEFGATITIAGSMAMKTETLPVAIFMRLASADIEGTVVLILILVAIGLTTLYAVRLLKTG
ncbi:ABC transporter permease [Dissulfurispira thermophila]|uniref:ABC transporter permease n=1 Tax=Dissulfurispira thermophila TaxID=2715679 RepID=A0A7G1GYQ2_9BACT|nr:ABC transporter permease [Dissulfurispira thermophila]BCB95338.1 ABC transporter permease [Dissulfurispira thermophila]